MIVLLSLVGAALAAAPPAATPTPTASAKPSGRAALDPNAIRCRRLSVTGSLADTKKVCKTNAEWRADADQARQTRICGADGNAC